MKGFLWQVINCNIIGMQQRYYWPLVWFLHVLRDVWLGHCKESVKEGKFLNILLRLSRNLKMYKVCHGDHPRRRQRGQRGGVCIHVYEPLRQGLECIFLSLLFSIPLGPWAFSATPRCNAKAPCGVCVNLKNVVLLGLWAPVLGPTWVLGCWPPARPEGACHRPRADRVG